MVSYWEFMVLRKLVKKIFKCMELLGFLFYLGIFMKIMEE